VPLVALLANTPSPSAFAPIAVKIRRPRFREALVALAGLDGPWQNRRGA
jgi:hypothetical protein